MNETDAICHPNNTNTIHTTNPATSQQDNQASNNTSHAGNNYYLLGFSYLVLGGPPSLTSYFSTANTLIDLNFL